MEVIEKWFVIFHVIFDFQENFDKNIIRCLEYLISYKGIEYN